MKEKLEAKKYKIMTVYWRTKTTDGSVEVVADTVQIALNKFVDVYPTRIVESVGNRFNNNDTLLII